MGDSASAPPPPDTSAYERGQTSLALENQAFAREQMDYGRQQQEFLNSTASGFLSQTVPEMEAQFEFAANLRDRYENTYQPLADQLIDEANRYQSKEEIEKQRGKAIQDVRVAQEAQRESAMRNLESYGIDPSQTRHQALDRQARVAEGGLAALAANNADERTRNIGRDLRKQALDFGTGELNAANTASEIGGRLGEAGTSAAASATNAGVNAGGGAVPYLSGAGQNYNSAAGIANDGYANEIAYAEDQRAAEGGMGGLGELAGMGLDLYTGGAFSAAKAVAGAADGGLVTGPGGPTDDAGVIGISNGEYVVPADVVKRMGTNHFDKLIEKETGRPPPPVKSALPMGAS